MTDVRKVRASLEELGMQVTSAGLEFVPRTLMSLDQDQLNSASTLIEALNDYPDVVRVWDNIQADSWEHFLDTLWTLNLFHVEYLILQSKVLSADTLYCLSLSIWKFVCFDARDKVGIKIKWWCLLRFFKLLNTFCHLTAPEDHSVGLKHTETISGIYKLPPLPFRSSPGSPTCFFKVKQCEITFFICISMSVHAVETLFVKYE